MGMLRQQADRLIVKDSNVNNVCVRVSHTQQYLVGIFSEKKLCEVFKKIRYLCLQ
jgi:hypothetical protein